MKNSGLLIKNTNFGSQKFIKLLLLETHLKQKKSATCF